MTEVDLLGLQSTEALERAVVGVAIRCPAATLELVGLARPLVDRVDRLPGEDDEAVIEFARRATGDPGVARRGDSPEAIERLVVPVSGT